MGLRVVLDGFSVWFLWLFFVWFFWVFNRFLFKSCLKGFKQVFWCYSKKGRIKGDNIVIICGSKSPNPEVSELLAADFECR